MDFDKVMQGEKVPFVLGRGNRQNCVREVGLFICVSCDADT